MTKTLANLFHPDLRISSQVPAGQCCRWEAPAPARSFTDIENGQISTGGRPGSDLHIWVVVPSPGPKATAQRRQAATRCWPGCFFAAIHPPAPTTLWPLNTLASQPSQSAGGADEVSEAQAMGRNSFKPVRQFKTDYHHQEMPLVLCTEPSTNTH